MTAIWPVPLPLTEWWKCPHPKVSSSHCAPLRSLNFQILIHLVLHFLRWLYTWVDTPPVRELKTNLEMMSRILLRMKVDRKRSLLHCYLHLCLTGLNSQLSSYLLDSRRLGHLHHHKTQPRDLKHLCILRQWLEVVDIREKGGVGQRKGLTKFNVTRGLQW